MNKANDVSSIMKKKNISSFVLFLLNFSLDFFLKFFFICLV